MSDMKITDRRLLFEGALAPGPAHNLAFPSLLICPDGSILLAHRVGRTKNSADGTQRLWRSGDAGVRWQPVRFPFLATPAGQPGEFRTLALSRIGPTRIAMLLTWIDHPVGKGDVPLSNAITGGLLPIHIGWSYSDDSGSTWSELGEIKPAPLVQPCGNGAMLRMSDGRLMVAFETYKEFDDPAPWSSRSVVMTSVDDGRTWQPPQIVAADPEQFVFYWDQHVHQLQDGTVIDMPWVDDRRKPSRSEIFLVRSVDGGRTWAKPEPTGISGQYSTVVELADGRLLLLYVQRTGEPSIRIRKSNDGGRSWDPTDSLVLHSQTADDLAAASKQSYEDYLRNMARWSFGWPTAVELPNGGLLVSYYVGEDDRSSVMLARVDLR